MKSCLVSRSSVSWFLVFGAWFLVYWFLGFKWYWFQSFSVSKCLGFLVSKVIGPEVSRFQSFNEPTLPQFHFILSGRYENHIQNSQELIRRIFMIVRCPSFPRNKIRFTKLSDVQNNNCHKLLQLS